MNKRPVQLFLTLLLAVALIAVFLTLRSSGERSPTGHAIGTPTDPPNVLLIIADDLGVDKLGAYADDVDPAYRDSAGFLPDTPVLDGLAEVGVRFTDAWANPTCSPTRATIFTGNSGFRTGVGLPVGHQEASELDYSVTTLAETLKLEGYTSGMFGKWHLGENDAPDGWREEDEVRWEAHLGERVSFEAPPLAQGWDMFRGSISGTLDGAEGDGYYHWLALENDRCEDCGVNNTLEVFQITEYATIQSINDARTWIARQDKPWMASVTLNAPHSPFELPPEGCSYRPEDAESPKNTQGIYEEMVECMDIQIGVLLDDIDDLENTLVIFIGDNGSSSAVAEGIYDDGRGKGTVYESGIRVPLIIADGEAILGLEPTEEELADCDPASQTIALGAGGCQETTLSAACGPAPLRIEERGSVSSALVHSVDLYATIAEVAGADGSDGLDAISLLPLLTGGEGPARGVIYSESFANNGAGSFALRRGDWKLISTVKETDGGLCRMNYQLYDLGADRGETESLLADEKNIKAADRETRDSLLAELDALADSAEEPPWFVVDACP